MELTPMLLTLNASITTIPQFYLMSMLYEGRSKSSRPDLVLFRIKLKYYLLLIVARLRTWRAQYDFWAINIWCIFLRMSSVCQMGVENANTQRYKVSEELREQYRRDPAKIYITTRYSG